jgi:hypothetical protein
METWRADPSLLCAVSTQKSLRAMFLREREEQTVTDISFSILSPIFLLSVNLKLNFNESDLYCSGIQAKKAGGF